MNQATTSVRGIAASFLAKASGGMPAKASTRSLTETFRMGAGKAPASWAQVSQLTVSADKGEKVTDIAGTVEAVFEERPTFYRLTFQDVALNKSTTSGFELHDLPAILGTGHLVPSPATQVDARTGYSITAIWWMPKEPHLTHNFRITFAPVSTRVDVTGSAVYMDRSYIGFAPSAASAAGTRFILVTSVAGQSSYR